MKKLTFLFLLLINFSLPAEEDSKVYIATVAKSGTYLLIKALKLMNVDFYAAQGRYDEDSWPQTGKPHIAHHMRGKTNEDLAEIFSPKNKYIVTYRDPRDWMISYLNWVSLGKDRKIDPNWLNIPFAARLNQAINGTSPEKYNGFIQWNWHFWDLELAAELKQKNWDHVLMLRFEDLIGPNGGGDQQKQEEALKSISNFLGLNLSDQEIDDIRLALWGGTFTFTEKTKKVGQWRDYFDKKAIADFKAKHNKMLVQLGYEKDANWGSKPL